MKKLIHFSLLLVIALGLTTVQAQKLPQTSVKFQTSDQKLQKLYERAEEMAALNIIDYGGLRVLKEGAKYVSVWLETQPMGGYMYAKRNMEVAKNNIEIFINGQRKDGRFPGVIYNRNGVVTPNYVQFQGFYFAKPAYEMYYLLNRDTAYLRKVYNSLESFDAYLWKTRDSDHNGCLETWCTFDTGEDDCVRYNGFPNGWAFDYPPTKEAALKLSKEELKTDCKEDDYDPNKEMKVPIESMDIMSYSYSCRDVLALISKELHTGNEKYWQAQADQVKTKLRKYLWDASKNACFDRDKENKTMPVLLHNNLRCMYYGSFSQRMADKFIRYHLINPEEFWTPMPLPSIAANDPAFKNVAGNNWSGQPQGLTYQRAISALENYGHYAELTCLGLKFLTVLEDSMKFTQQFDPFTGKINNSKDGYGPSILTTLELISRFYGVHLTQDKIYWSCLDSSHDYAYTQEWNGRQYSLQTRGNQVICSVDGRYVFGFTKGVRVVTDLNGNLLEIVGIADKPEQLLLSAGDKISLEVKPNTAYRPDPKGVWRRYQSIAFYKPVN